MSKRAVAGPGSAKPGPANTGKPIAITWGQTRGNLAQSSDRTGTGFTNFDAATRVEAASDPSLNVRFAPMATELLRRREMPQWAPNRRS